MGNFRKSTRPVGKSADNSQHSIPFTLVAAFLSTRDGFLPITASFKSLVASLVVAELIVWTGFDMLSGMKHGSSLSYDDIAWNNSLV